MVSNPAEWRNREIAMMQSDENGTKRGSIVQSRMERFMQEQYLKDGKGEVGDGKPFDDRD